MASEVPARGAGQPAQHLVQRGFGRLVEFYVFDGAALGAHGVMVMTGEPFGELVPGEAIGVVLPSENACFVEHGQRAVERREGDARGLVEQLGSGPGARHRAQRLDDLLPAGGVANVTGRKAAADRLVEFALDFALHRWYLTTYMRMILNFKTNLRTAVAMAVSAALLTSACGDGADSEDRLRIVASTSIIGDIVAEVVGDAVAVEVIIGPGIDPHDFQVSARQVESVERADLVIAFGLGLEESLIDVIDSQAAAAFYLGPELDPLPFVGPDVHEDEEHEAEGLDPHIWLDPNRMAAAVPLIVERIESLEPDIDLNAAGYIETLEELDREITETLAAIPPESRKLVTSHEALGYFAARYDFEVIGVIVAGGSTLAEPSAADLATLAEAIEDSGVRAIFTDAYNPTTLAEAVASEVEGDVAVVPLITGSLTEEAGSYVEMMRINADRIAGALGGDE